jgi:hypothetical protein
MSDLKKILYISGVVIRDPQGCIHCQLEVI